MPFSKSKELQQNQPIKPQNAHKLSDNFDQDIIKINWALSVSPAFKHEYYERRLNRMILEISSIHFAEKLLKNAYENQIIDLNDHSHRIFEITEMPLYFTSHKGYILKKIGNVTDEMMRMAELEDGYVEDIGGIPAVFPCSPEEKGKDGVLCHGVGGNRYYERIWMAAWRMDLFGPF